MMLEIERAEGMYFFDADGTRYMDLIAGISVANLGHSHPDIVAAIKKQADQYLHVMVYGEFVQGPQVDLADTLLAQLPDSLDRVYFVNSGSEAVEGALKAAKKYTGRSELLSFENGYHGSTHGALSLIGDPSYKKGFEPLLPETQVLPFNKTASLDAITEKTAAVLVEPIQGEAGVIEAEPAFMQNLKQRCLETGAVLIFDEIQCGRI